MHCLPIIGYNEIKNLPKQNIRCLATIYYIHKLKLDMYFMYQRKIQHTIVYYDFESYRMIQ